MYINLPSIIVRIHRNYQSPARENTRVNELDTKETSQAGTILLKILVNEETMQNIRRYHQDNPLSTGKIVAHSAIPAQSNHRP